MTADVRKLAIDHAIGATGNLSVKVASSDIFLVPSNDDHVRVRTLDGRSLPAGLRVETTDDRLEMREAGRFLGVDFSVGESRSTAIEIEVPVTATSTIQTASGSIAANGLRGEQQYRTASGEVRLDAASGHVTTETVSGDVTIAVDGTADLIVKTVSGDVAIDGELIEQVRLTTTSGDIQLVSSLGTGPHAIETLSGDALIATDRGVRVTARTISGDLRSDLPHTTGGMMGRRTLTVGDGSVELSFRSVSGDLRVVDSAGARDRLARKSAARDARRADGPAVPLVPTPPAPPAPPSVATASVPSDPAVATATNGPDDRRLEILRALERGDIDIAAAGAQLALLDESSHD